MIKINSIEEDFNLIEEFGEEIKLYVNSDIRLEIMTSLFTSPSTLKLLQKSTELNYTSISTNIAKLEERNIVKKEKEYYYLRKQAAIKLVNILLLENNLIFLYDFENFLNNHQVKNDNIEILSTLPYMKNVDLLQANNINPDVAIETFQENMLSKGSVKAISLILQRNYKEIIDYLMSHKTDFEIIASENLTKHIMQEMSKYKDTESVKCRRFNVIKTPDDLLKIALVVSHDKVVLGLVRKEGNFNKSCVLVSHEEIAVTWAYNLFKEYESFKDEFLTLDDTFSQENNPIMEE